MRPVVSVSPYIWMKLHPNVRMAWESTSPLIGLAP